MGKPSCQKSQVKQSTTDPDSGWFVKNEKEQTFAYSFHAASDHHGFVVSTVITAANVHDSQVFTEVFERAVEHVGKPNAVAVDAGYKTPYISKYLLDEGVRPVMPYTRPHTKEGLFRKHEYVYDEYYDCFLCPAGQVLSYETTTRNGYRMYRSNPKTCILCPLRSQCTGSREAVKRISRHIWADYLDEVEHLRHTEMNKRLYARRKETIERVFADLKEKHGLRWTTLRGLKKVEMQVMLVFACMNLKKLANWLWRLGKKGGRALTGRFQKSIYAKANSLCCSQRGSFVCNLNPPLWRIFLSMVESGRGILNHNPHSPKNHYSSCCQIILEMAFNSGALMNEETLNKSIFPPISCCSSFLTGPSILFP